MSLFSGILSIVLSVVLITGVVIPTVRAANTTGWSAGDVTIFGLISTVSVLGLVYGVANVFGMV
jgi:hypothetical protein